MLHLHGRCALAVTTGAAAAAALLAVAPGAAVAAPGAGPAGAVSAPAARRLLLDLNAPFTRVAGSERLTRTVLRPSWTVAAVKGLDGGESDLLVAGPGGTPLGRSAEGFGVTDWVAVDNTPGHHPTGVHTLAITANRAPASPKTRVQSVTGKGALVPGQTVTVGRPAGDWLVDLRDAPLLAGEMLGLTVRGEAVGTVYVLFGDPARPATWAQTRSAALATFHLPKPETDDQAWPLTFTAPATGTYAIVFEPRGWWSTTSTVEATLIG